ncbi:uncharacterized protein LOC119106254 [Pollicipes pollicipes]|uniref:uncharacterized protein LOC119106254 n=1 Tax=Pollicipes pollicipes TaxID=41117 RepID=UPI0018849D28|nr:uncharacterized protein LOC119106254 [Pollicipes pollicipes]
MCSTEGRRTEARFLFSVALVHLATACMPEMSFFRFGGCPNMTAAYGQDLYQASGRWYVLRTSTSKALWPATCTTVDVGQPYTNSSRYELLYRYRKAEHDHVEVVRVEQDASGGGIHVQNKWLLGLFGRERLVLDTDGSGLATVLACQPLLLGHMTYGAAVEPERHRGGQRSGGRGAAGAGRPRGGSDGAADRHAE